MNSNKKMGQPILELIRFDSADVIATSGIPSVILGEYEQIMIPGQTSYISPNPMSNYQEPISQ